MEYDVTTEVIVNVNGVLWYTEQGWPFVYYDNPSYFKVSGYIMKIL